MEISEKAVTTELRAYKSTLISAKRFAGTAEGNMHRFQASTTRAILLRLGLMDDELNSRIVKQVEDELEKIRVHVGGAKT